MRRPKVIGPYTVDSTIPDWEFTVTGLADSGVYDGAELHLDNPDGEDFDLGSPSFALATPSSTSLTVSMTADTTKTFDQAGRWNGELLLLVGAVPYSVQRFTFKVVTGPAAT